MYPDRSDFTTKTVGFQYKLTRKYSKFYLYLLHSQVESQPKDLLISFLTAVFVLSRLGGPSWYLQRYLWAERHVREPINRFFLSKGDSRPSQPSRLLVTLFLSLTALVVSTISSSPEVKHGVSLYLTYPWFKSRRDSLPWLFGFSSTSSSYSEQ